MKKYKHTTRIKTQNQKYEKKFVPVTNALIKSWKYAINVNGPGSLINDKK
ncbi:MAG: hypothetical protein WCF28_07995 [Methanobacterium sp.]